MHFHVSGLPVTSAYATRGDAMDAARGLAMIAAETEGAAVEPDRDGYKCGRVDIQVIRCSESH